MANIAIDVGKRKSYFVVEQDGKIVKESYVKTDRESFSSLLGEYPGSSIVMEASSTIDRIAPYVEEYSSDITVAHPMKLKVISQSMKKTDRNDAHILLELNRLGYVPESYLPSVDIRRSRDLCRNRAFLVKQRTAVKNRIRDQAYRLGIDFRDFNKKTDNDLRSASCVLNALVNDLESLNHEVYELDKIIRDEVESSPEASLIYTIPGIGYYGALAIASEIGDVGRFPSEDNIFSYAGLVPKIHQSGNREWKGHIAKGNTFLKYLLVECVQIHLMRDEPSPIKDAYERIESRSGTKKARIAAARHMLRAIYYMLKKHQNYDEYLKKRRGI